MSNGSTVHVENTVRDFETWKSTFDKYEQFRADQGVQSYRVSRCLTEPNDVFVDLDFADDAAAEAFLPKLAKIMDTPQARDHLVQHHAPRIYTVVTHRSPTS